MLERLVSQGVPREKLRFVPAWASQADIDPEAVEAVRRAHGWDGRFVVMHAGNVGAATDVDVCLDAASLLQDAPDVVLVFLGGGPGKPALAESLARRRLGNVELRPPVAKSQAHALMAAADLHLIALVPGLWGCGAPSKAYGIMAARRPFVAAVDPDSEPARIAEEHRCGLVVPAGSAEALAAAIRAARDAPLDAMAALGYAEFLRRYERSVATSALGDVLADAARRERSAALA